MNGIVINKRDEQAHGNYSLVLSDTTRSFSSVVDGWCLKELPNFGGNTAMSSTAYSYDAGQAQRE